MSDEKQRAGGGRLKAVPGMNDWMPPGSRRLQTVETIARRVLERFGYGEVRTPVVEPTALFARSIGGTTDIVEKEMYTFADRDKHSLTLRPEGTAGAVRAYVEHSVGRQEPVTRWYYLGPMFRHERAQRGRYRQFYQLGAEALGVAEPGVDAEMIDLLVSLLAEVGLTDVELHLNSLGCAECRPAHRRALIAYLEPHSAELCEDCQRRLSKNPLRVLDCKQAGCRMVAEGAPQTLDSVCGACSTHWEGMLGDLAALGIDHRVNPRLVRGLDYYSRTTFEITSSAGKLGSQNTIVGGGRYDRLVEDLGGAPTPAIGFGMGLERLLLALPEDAPVVERPIDVCFVTRGDVPRRAALPLARALRAQGARVEVEQRATSVKSQMKRAGRIGAPLVVLIGEAELERGVVTLREMTRSEQDEIATDALVDEVARRLAAL